MSIKKRTIGIVMALLMIVNISYTGIQVSASEIDQKSIDLPIISTTSVTVSEAQEWAKKRNATDTFISLAPLYEKYAKERGKINWLVAYVQAAKETGYGNFGGVLDETYYNPCGLKSSSGGSDSDPNAHKRFDNWEQGVIAHLDHLAIYAGAENYPKEKYISNWQGSNIPSDSTYDPRHFKTIYGKSPTVAGLGGNWAPSSNYGKEVLDLYYSISLLPRGRVDEPDDGTIVKSNTLNLRGWAANSSGVKQINIYIDNVSLGQANYGESRPDIASAYPQYPNAQNSGFDAQIDLTNISDGNKIVVLEVVGNDGSTYDLEKSINIDRAKLPSLGRIDEPSEGLQVTGDTVTVRGWTVNGSGVKEIKVLVDGQLKAKTNVGQDRPDIANAYPQYPNAGKSGFKVDVNVSDIQNGAKKIVAEVVGNDNSVYTMERTINLNRKTNTLKSLGRIDEPSEGLQVTGDTVTVRGWTVNGSGVKEIKVLVDGQLKAKTNVGQDRPDIANAYPQYPNAGKSGFKVDVNVSDIQNGAKKIVAEVVGNDNSVYTMERTINLNRKTNTLKSLGRIDEPSEGLQVTGDTVTVRGWTVNGSGVKEIKVLVDGQLKAKTNVGQDRPDIANAYPQYPNAGKSGFKVDVNVSDIQNGAKKIVAEVVGNDNSVYTMERTINLNRKTNTLKSLGRIDEPSEGLQVTGDTVTVRGWTVNGSGVKEIKVLVDGQLKAKTNVGQDRPDIANAYPQYPNAGKSGFKVDVNVSDIQNGAKKIVAEVVGNDNSVYTMERTINVNRKTNTLKPLGRIDEPTDNVVVNGSSLLVRGWAVNQSGVKLVKIFIDDKIKATIKVGEDRPDIANAYPQYPNADKSGFKININIDDIANGDRKLVAQVIGNDDSVYNIQRNIKVNRSVLKSIGRIDEPSDGLVVSGNKMKIRGWALTNSGVDQIKVYIDGTYLGNANIGLDRSDIANAYPLYSNSGKAGFEFIVNTEKLTSGQRNITLEVISKDGSKFNLNRSFIIRGEDDKQTLGRIDDPIENVKYYKNKVKIRGWAINPNGVKEVRVYVNGVDKGTINYGTSRPDVNSAYPGYPSGNNAGYEGVIDISDIPLGNIEIKVDVISKNNTSKSFKTFLDLKANASKVIVVDPGHNLSWDRGAIATHNNKTYVEGELNMEISLKLKSELEKRGFYVVLARDPGEHPTIMETYPNLMERVNLANNTNADAFISIHHNSAGASAKGIEVYYSSEEPGTKSIALENEMSFAIETQALDNDNYKLQQSRHLATNIVDEASKALSMQNRGAKDEAFIVVKHTTVPSILIESGFITNKSEAEFISSPANQQKLAEIIANNVAKQF
ncbi:N-acetylmuramoyl-L-alanine amidase [Clostridium septicum]|uniref:N-acetylmuramoyl-L-alanine amidase n=1 Tax=Clostridium septicum TaxID=1504 RepID=UPI00272E996A|nr:N-acetylmuramoyl-L-alanine amidase [Clostridium septicum]WLF70052.1 Ig-like domain-containing protein [Clostridium septicum]